MWSSTLVRNYEYDNNSMDDFNAKSDNVQSDSGDKIIELEEMVNNNLQYSEAEPFDPFEPFEKECGINDSLFCNSHEDCKQCHDCPAKCDLWRRKPLWGKSIAINGKWIAVNGDCRCRLPKAGQSWLDR